MYTLDEKLVSASQQDLVRRAIGRSYLQQDWNRNPDNLVADPSKDAEFGRYPVNRSKPVQKGLLLRLLSIVIKF